MFSSAVSGVKLNAIIKYQARGNIYEGRGGKQSATNVMPKVQRVVSREGMPPAD